MVIIFWNFTIFQFMSDSPQVKQSLISSITNLIYELPYKLVEDVNGKVNLITKYRNADTSKNLCNFFKA